MKTALRLGLIVAALALGAWLWLGRGAAGPPGPPTPEDIARAGSLQPANPALAAIYARSCVSCHAVPEAQAPLTGRRAAWAWRLDQRGIEGLLTSARAGYGNMPAMGLCFECTEAEFRGLIAFMSGETS